MSLYGDNSLYSTATHPRLTNNTLQHSTSNSFFDAAALDPYTHRTNTPQTVQSNTRQSRFAGDQILPPNTHEKLEDVSTWKLDTIRKEATDVYHNLSHGLLNAQENCVPTNADETLDDVSTWQLDTIRQVAMEVYQNPGLALFDVQDQCVPATPNTFLLDCVPNSNDGDSEYDEEDLSAFARMELDHRSLYGDLSDDSYAPLPSARAGSRQRKLKMHEWLPQSDPELEKRRKRAVRQHLQRQREQQEIQQLERDLRDRRREVAELIPEANRLRRRVQILEQYAAQQGLSST